MSRPANFSTGKGRPCPKCSSVDTKVTDVRTEKGESVENNRTLRRRRCRVCGSRWRTAEIGWSTWSLMKRFLKASEKKMKADKKAARTLQPTIEEREQLRRELQRIEASRW